MVRVFGDQLLHTRCGFPSRVPEGEHGQSAGVDPSSFTSWGFIFNSIRKQIIALLLLSSHPFSTLLSYPQLDLLNNSEGRWLSPSLNPLHSLVIPVHPVLQLLLLPTNDNSKSKKHDDELRRGNISSSNTATSARPTTIWYPNRLDLCD